MYCSNCGQAIVEGARFCAGCGATAQATVPATRLLWVAKVSASSNQAAAGIGCGWRRRNLLRSGTQVIGRGPPQAKSSQVYATSEAGAW